MFSSQQTNFYSIISSHKKGKGFKKTQIIPLTVMDTASLTECATFSLLQHGTEGVGGWFSLGSAGMT